MLVPLTVGLGIAVLTFIAYGYQGKAWTQETIFWISDGHCTVPEGIGAHCFGDFALPFFAAGNPGIYHEGSIVLSINPPTLLFFELFKTFTFKEALFLYQLLAIGAICFPFLRKPPHVSWADAVSWMIVAGLLTLGSLAALDRGNNVAFVSPLLFLYIVSLHRKKWGLVVLAVVLIAAIKIWSVYLIIGLVAFRKYRLAATALFLSGLVNLAGILVMHVRGFPESIVSKVRFTIDTMLSKGYADMVSAYAISFSGLTKRIACLVQQDGACDMIAVSNTSVGSSLIKSMILVLCLVVVVVLVRSRHVPPYVWMTAIGGLGIVAVPEAFVYNAVVVVGCLGAIVHTSMREPTNPGVGSDKSWELLSSLPLVASLTPAVFVHHQDWGTAIQMGDEILWRSYYWTIPIAWLFFFLGSTTLVTIVRRRETWNRSVEEMVD